MFNISKLVNKITDRGSREGGDSTTGSGSMSFVETEEQHSEGFLCPPCMRAFPSPEALEAHYKATHEQQNDISNGDEDVKGLREEIQNLQMSLAEEQVTSEELKREVQKMQVDLKKEDLTMQEQEKGFEGVKTLLHSEVTLLRKQLTDSLEQNSSIKKEKEEACQKLVGVKSEIESLKSAMANLESQLAHKNSLDDAAVLKQELVSVQRMMDQLALQKEEEVQNLKEKIGNLQKSKKNVDILEPKLVEFTKQLYISNNLVSQYKSDIEKLKGLRESEMKQASEKIKEIRTQLDDSSIRNTEFQNESSTLKDEIKRLNEQHNELYRRVEGGEGAKAALDALQQENELLKGNITTLNQKNAELTSTLQQQQNLIVTGNELKVEFEARIETFQAQVKTIQEEVANLLQQNSQQKTIIVEKLAEIEKLTKQEENLKQVVESLTSDNQELKSQALKSKEVFKEKDLTIQQFEQQSTNFSNSFNQKVAELTATREQHEKLVIELNFQLQEHSIVKESQNKRLSEIEVEKESLLKRIQEEEIVTKALRETEDTLLKQLKEKSEESSQVSKSLEESQSKIRELEKNLSNAQNQNKDIQKTSKAQVAELEGKLKAEGKAALERIKKLEEILALKETEVKDAKESLEKAVLKESEKSAKLDELKTSLETFETNSKESESKLQSLKLQTDTVLGEKIEFERRLKSIEEEKALLLEKLLSGESDMEQMHQKMQGIQRKLDDAYAALQELGRENQNLQMESAKMQGRKWADDSVVQTCSSCTKEFTLTIRKHHCRACYQIFCGECSSRTAAVPSCKKPARVCDNCYQELLIK